MRDRTWEARDIADEIAAARATGGRLSPFTGRFADFDLDGAYRVAGILACQRAARSPVVGRKIGFTNRATWEGAGLTQPVWGSMFEETVIRTGDDSGFPILPMAGSVEPKIECEVVLALASEPPAGGRGAEVARHVAEAGLGFEVVDSPYPRWKMRPADAVATGGIHHALAVGPLVPAEDPEELTERLAGLRVAMTRDGVHAADGAGSLVMGNPLDALGALAGLAAAAGNPLRTGEIVTTGTLTPPLYCARGEVWQADAEGGALPAASVVLVP